MTIFLIRRILAIIPSVAGISIITFALMNLSQTDIEETGGDEGPEYAHVTHLEKMYGFYLPLFFNWSIQDAKKHAFHEIKRLSDERTSPSAIRIISQMGGAWLPYILPALPKMDENRQKNALAALDIIAGKINLDTNFFSTSEKVKFWTHYYETYGADYSKIRTRRLVKRYVENNDNLALAQLKRLDTFSISSIMELVEEDNLNPEEMERIINFAMSVTGISDPVWAQAPTNTRNAALERWREWWSGRYDWYTSFEGFDQVTGAVTQTRYFRWLSRIITFDFGISITDGRPVWDKMKTALPITLFLTLTALVTSYLIAIILGTWLAVTRKTVFERGTSISISIIYSLPPFIIAMVFARYFETTFYVSADEESFGVFLLIKKYFIPVLCLAYVSSALLTGVQKEGMRKVISLDYIKAARAKGLSRFQTILRHGLKNSIVPLVTMIGIQLPYLLSGCVVIETVFNIPGIGYETLIAISNKDYPWLVAVVTVCAIITMVGTVIADMVHALIDPRIAFENTGKVT